MPLGSRLLMVCVPQSCSRLDTRERHKKPPAEAGGKVHANPRRRAAVRLAGLRPLTVNPALRAWHLHEKPRVATREHAAREPAASCRGSLGRPPPAWNQPGPPGLALPQEAPGGNPGTPGRMPSRVPCDVGLHREITCSHTAWTVGWLSCPESPGSCPGLLGPVMGPTPCSRVVTTRFAVGSLQRRRSVELLRTTSKLTPRPSRARSPTHLQPCLAPLTASPPARREASRRAA